MKTERLYYDDAYCRDFEAAIVRVEPRADARAVWLDRTAFYPSSGGQPFDTGFLGGCAVTDVVVDDDDDVAHVVRGDAPLAARQVVRGAIDWERRFDHMQQHTGQHILSAAIVRLLHVPTVSFHMGRDTSTIDLARELSPAELHGAEAEANRIVWENRPVSVRYADAGAAGTLGLRKPSARSGTLRLVDIEGVDLSACGGSHVSQSGGVGVIVLKSWERFKGGQRIEFQCGGRALVAARQLRDIVSAGGRLLSVVPNELTGAIERLQADLREQQRLASSVSTELAMHQAAKYAAAAETVGGVGLVRRSVDGDATVLRTLAVAITAGPGLVAARGRGAVEGRRSGV
jgi:alanyl-tRNA synthetase